MDGDLDAFFRLEPPGPRPRSSGTVLETYAPHRRRCLTVVKPADAEDCVFLHPGEPVFDRLRGHVCAAVLRGRVARRRVRRPLRPPALPVPSGPGYGRPGGRPRPGRLRPARGADLPVGRYEGGGRGTDQAVRGRAFAAARGADGLPLDARPLAARAAASREQARIYALEQVAGTLAERRRRNCSTAWRPGWISWIAATTTRTRSWPRRGRG